MANIHKYTSLPGGRAAQKLVENVKAALVVRLAKRARLFQQVRFNVRAADETRKVEVDADEFALKQFHIIDGARVGFAHVDTARRIRPRN